MGMEFDSKLFLPFYHLAGASPLPLEVGYRFLVGSNILLSTVVRQQVVILEFSEEKISAQSYPALGKKKSYFNLLKFINIFFKIED